MNNPPTPPVELSDEMKEAIRILREDGQISAFNKMTVSHQQMITRMDEVEDNWSAWRAEQTKAPETDPPKPSEPGPPSNSPPSPTPDPTIPEPPPDNPPPTPPTPKTRVAWWERDTYTRD